MPLLTRERGNIPGFNGNKKCNYRNNLGLSRMVFARGLFCQGGYKSYCTFLNAQPLEY